MSTARAAPWTWSAVVFMTAAASHALSLRSTRAEAFLGDVRPGSRVAYSKTLGAPFGVENPGTEPAVVELTFSTPPPERLADGYEPIPDPGWAMATVPRHSLAPGEKGVTEIVVSVPKDRSLEGRQFQLECGLSGRSPGGGTLKLRTKLLLAVGDGDPPESPPLPPDAQFAASPGHARLDGVKLGRAGPLRGPGFSGVKLANTGGKDATVRVSATRSWPEGVSLPPGYVAAPNPRWLSAGPSLRVPAGMVRTMELELHVPRETRYRGRKWAFPLAVDVESGGKAGRTWIVLEVSTEP